VPERTGSTLPPPHQGPSFALKSRPIVRFFFIGFRRGGEVCLFLILYWCSAFAESWDGPSILGPNSRNSRFGRINSRLGGCKFPLRATTGICRQPVDLLESFTAEWHFCREIEKIPGSTGKTGNSAPAEEQNDPGGADGYPSFGERLPAARNALGSWPAYIGRPGLASRNGVPVSASWRSSAAGAQRSP
jgi:hypothetical protein